MGFKKLKPAKAKAPEAAAPKGVVLGPAKNWSFSSLQKYEACPHFTKLKAVDKCPGPPRDPNSPAERGSRIHDAAEQYVRGQRDDLVPEMKDFKDHVNALRKMFAEGRVTCEEDWAYDVDMNPVEWTSPNAWLRLKLDVHVDLDATTAVVIDYKSGKRFGNEVKHQQQGALYAAIAAMRWPDVSKIIVEFWYIDQNETSQVEYTRRQAMLHWARFRERGLDMTTATRFPAKPSEPNCKFCDYSCNSMANKQTGKVYFQGTGVCEFDVYRR